MTRHEDEPQSPLSARRIRKDERRQMQLVQDVLNELATPLRVRANGCYMDVDLSHFGDEENKRRVALGDTLSRVADCLQAAHSTGIVRGENLPENRALVRKIRLANVVPNEGAVDELINLLALSSEKPVELTAFAPAKERLLYKTLGSAFGIYVEVLTLPVFSGDVKNAEVIVASARYVAVSRPPQQGT